MVSTPAANFSGVARAKLSPAISGPAALHLVETQAGVLQEQGEDRSEGLVGARRRGDSLAAALGRTATLGARFRLRIWGQGAVLGQEAVAQ